MYRIYKPIDSDITYAIKLTADGAYIFDSGTKRRAFVDGDFGTINEALGVYLLRQLRVDDAYGVLMQGAFNCPE